MQSSLVVFLIWVSGAFFLLSLPLSHTNFFKLLWATVFLVTFGIGQIRKRNAAGWTYGLLLLVPGLICLAALLGFRSSYFGKTQDPRFTTLTLDERKAFLPRGALAWIPEADMKSAAIRFSDWLGSEEDEERRYERVMDAYDRLAEEGAIVDLRTEAGLVFGGAKIPQAYVFVPQSRPGNRPLRLMIVLPDHGPNWQFPLAWWAQLGERHGMAVAIPSLGRNDWHDNPLTLERMDAVIDGCRELIAGVGNEVILAGVGTGGRAVWRYGGSFLDRIGGYIVIAGGVPPMDEVHRVKKRPTLLVHGEDDGETEAFRVGSAASAIKSASPRSRYVPVRGAGRKVYESHPNEVFSAIEEWLAAGASFAPPAPMPGM